MGLIYKITNRITEQIYVGKTTRTLNERWSGHKAKHRHSKQYVHASMKTYGIDNFDITILEECDNLIIDERERYWIEYLDSMAPKNFNMTSGGDGGDTSDFIDYSSFSEKFSGENNPMYGKTSAMKGRTHTDKTKELQGSARQKYWDNLSEDKRKERAQSISGDKNPMYGKQPTNNPGIKIEYDGIVYDSIGSASKITGISIHFIKKNGKIL